MDTTANGIVIGYDTSRESELALEWAASVAQRRGVTLTVVHATGVEHAGVDLARTGVLEMYRQRAQTIAEKGARRARQHADINVTAIGIHRGAAAALTDYSHNAALIVIGHRSRGMLSDTLLGSVAFTVTTHAACPVAVIRGALRPLPSLDHPVVVGLDGSEHSTPALDEAAFLAADTHSFLRIVVAWRQPEANLWSNRAAYQSASDTDVSVGADRDAAADGNIYQQIVTGLAQRAADTAQWAVDHVRERYPELRVEPVIAENEAEQAIIDAATDASLIVVGARGFSDIKSLLLGSVSRKVMQRAQCAVYVVR